LARQLFPNGAPILAKQQFVGFANGLVITAEHNGQWDSLLKMAIHCPQLRGEAVTWLSPASLYPMCNGFKSYVSGKIFRPASAEAKKVECRGFFRDWSIGGNLIYWLRVPAISGDVLLRKEKINSDE
jgi:hypothetical protein